MALRDEHDIEKLLMEVNSVVDQIEQRSQAASLDTEPLRLPDDPDNEPDDGSSESINDGYAQLYLSEDHMTATADFFPPIGRGKPLSSTDFGNQLAAKGIIFGIQWEWIEKTLTECLNEGKTIRDTIVAQGALPENALSERWEIIPELLEQKKTIESDAVFLDMKAFSPFQFVKKDDVIARVLPAQEGTVGCNVLGKEVAFHTHSAQNPTPRQNIVKKDKEFRAACDGCFYLIDDKFWVENVLLLSKGVSYETGNIDYSGDVIIQGEVAYGFKVKAAGSIYSSEVVDVTEITAGGDVVTSSGFKGQPGATVTSGRAIRCKYAENVKLHAKDLIEIGNSSLNSFLQTQGKVVMTFGAIAMGGKIQAQNGVDLHQVGNARGGKVEIVCGMDFDVLDKIIWIRDQNMKLVQMTARIDRELQRNPPSKQSLYESKLKIAEQIKKLSKTAAELLTQIDRNERAEIVVRGTIFPGNYLEICHMSYIVSKPMSRVRFFLDKHKGQVSFSGL